MSRLRAESSPVNGDISSMAESFLTSLNQTRRDQLAPAPVIDSPLHRDQRQEMELVTVAVANTLREQLEETTGDRLDLAVALDIAAACLETYYEAKVALIRSRR